MIRTADPSILQMLAEHERFDLEKLSGFERFILEITATTVPHHRQKDYIEHYSCKPPPIFMILISLVEVSEVSIIELGLLQREIGVYSKSVSHDSLHV